MSESAEEFDRQIHALCKGTTEEYDVTTDRSLERQGGDRARQLDELTATEVESEPDKTDPGIALSRVTRGL